VHPRSNTEAPIPPVGVHLVGLRKREGKWLIIAHESAIPNPATTAKEL